VPRLRGPRILWRSAFSRNGSEAAGGGLTIMRWPVKRFFRLEPRRGEKERRQLHTDGGTVTVPDGTRVATDTCGQVRPLKFSMTV